MDDPFNLQRFVDAQNSVIERVRGELRAGEKRSHWMWYVFPQRQGLGLSEMSRRYAISGNDEAAAYLAHPVLGPRLLELTAIVAGQEGRSLEQIFGGIDAMKFRSCMSLFAEVAPREPIFRQALGKYGS